MNRLAPSLAFLALGSSAFAANGFTLSEIFINPPGTDDGQEAIEIAGPASSSLAGYYLVIVEGDGTAAGTVDVVIDLGALSTGSNGLLLLRDTATPILPLPDANTAIFTSNFTPDIENGSNSYLLGFGTPPTVTSDLDVDNDGTAEVGLPGFTVVDAVSLVENDGASNFAYADDFGGTLVGPFAGPVPAAFNSDVLYRVYDVDGNPFDWISGDVLGTNPGGPYSFDVGAGRIFNLAAFGISTLDISPGNTNLVKTLKGTPGDVSILAGGSHTLTLKGGVANANKTYYVFGSVTGTSPGLPFNANVTLPLNYDLYFDLFILAPNTFMSNSFASFDANGTASATLFVPAGITTLPFAITLNHAFVTLNAFNVAIQASNPVPLILNP